jgi:hypothetical protein
MAGAVFAVCFLLFFFEDVKGFAWEIRAVNIFGIENITKLVTDKTVNTYLFKPDPTPNSIFCPFGALDSIIGKMI